MNWLIGLGVSIDYDIAQCSDLGGKKGFAK